MKCGVSVSKMVKASPSSSSKLVKSEQKKNLPLANDKSWVQEAEFEDFKHLKRTEEKSEEVFQQEEEEDVDEDEETFEPDLDEEDDSPAVVVAPVQDREEKKRLVRMETIQGKTTQDKSRHGTARHFTLVTQILTF